MSLDVINLFDCYILDIIIKTKKLNNILIQYVFSDINL